MGLVRRYLILPSLSTSAAMMLVMLLLKLLKPDPLNFHESSIQPSDLALSLHNLQCWNRTMPRIRHSRTKWESATRPDMLYQEQRFQSHTYSSNNPGLVTDHM